MSAINSQRWEFLHLEVSKIHMTDLETVYAQLTGHKTTIVYLSLSGCLITKLWGIFSKSIRLRLIWLSTFNFRPTNYLKNSEDFDEPVLCLWLHIMYTGRVVCWRVTPPLSTLAPTAIMLFVAKSIWCLVSDDSTNSTQLTKIDIQSGFLPMSLVALLFLFSKF